MIVKEMKTNITKLISYLALIPVLFCGISCATYTNIDAKQIRSDRYYKKTIVFDKSLKDCAANLYQFCANCRNVGQLTIDPNDNKKGIITLTQDFGQYNILLIMDFTENEEGTQTTAACYSYYSAWSKDFDMFANAINDPTNCP